MVLRRTRANNDNGDLQTNLCNGEESSQCDPDQRVLFDNDIALAMAMPLKDLPRRVASSLVKIDDGNSGRRDFILGIVIAKKDSGQGRLKHYYVIDFS